MDRDLKSIVLDLQKNEITQYAVYMRIAQKLKGSNKKVLESIARDELKHYEKWKEFTGEDLKPSRWEIFKYILIGRVLGLTFVIKMMEKAEEKAEEYYEKILDAIPSAKEVLEDERRHERALVEMIDENRLKYISSMILGVSDAIVELTGAIAGMTFAFRNSSIVGIAAMITGIAAALSMSVSEYLSQKSESEEGKSPLSAAFYTGIAYMLAVFFLVVPFFIFSIFIALAFSLLSALVIIAIFTFFVSVVKEKSFKKLFLEMSILSFSVAGLSFIIGILARKFLGVDI